MTDLQQAALILLASSRNPSYGPEQAVREAERMSLEIAAVFERRAADALEAARIGDCDPGDCG